MGPRDNPRSSRSGTARRPPETADCHANPSIEDGTQCRGDTRDAGSTGRLLFSWLAVVFLTPARPPANPPGRQQQANQALQALVSVFLKATSKSGADTYAI